MTSQEIGNQRLLVLADFIESLPADSVDMHSWVSNTEGLREGDIPLTQVVRIADVTVHGVTVKDIPSTEITGCGFAACAIGWACTIGQFQQLGLQLQHFPVRMGQQCNTAVRLIPTYRQYTGFDAAKAFFDLDHHAALNLFDIFAYDVPRPDRSIVAQRIRQCVASRQVG